MATGTVAQFRAESCLRIGLRARGGRQRREAASRWNDRMGARSRGRNRRTGPLQSYPQHASEAAKKAQWREQARVDGEHEEGG